MSDLDIEQRPSRLPWFLAAIAALPLHLGGAAFALTHLQSNEVDDELGAPAIEVGLEMMAPKVEATDLPPGPESDASMASPALAEQKAELKETDLPKNTPTETDDSDRAVTLNDSDKPVEEEKKIAAVETPASQQSVAAEATATPSSDAIQRDRVRLLPRKTRAKQHDAYALPGRRN